MVDSSYYSFLEFCRNSLNLMYTILDLARRHWYFALLFAAGFIWIGFDLIEGVLGNSEYYGEE